MLRNKSHELECTNFTAVFAESLLAVLVKFKTDFKDLFNAC